jgi:hypothetical protein
MQVKERREDVLVLLTKGMKGCEIAKQLGVRSQEIVILNLSQILSDSRIKRSSAYYQTTTLTIVVVY